MGETAKTRSAEGYKKECPETTQQKSHSLSELDIDLSLLVSADKHRHIVHMLLSNTFRTASTT